MSLSRVIVCIVQFTLLSVSPLSIAPGVSAQPATRRVAPSIIEFGADPTGVADSTSAFQQAVAESPAGGAIRIPCGRYKLASTVTISAIGVTFQGSGYCSSLIIAGTDDAFLVRSALFAAQDMEITVGASSARTGSSIFNIQSQQGYIRNVRINGEPGIDNGRIFDLNTSAAGIWTLDHVSVTGGVTWDWGIRSIAPTRTIADIHIRGYVVSNTITWITAGLVIDQGTDTFSVVDSTPGPILIQNSGTNINPRWIHFTNTFTEGLGGLAGGTALKILAGRNISYQGYIASASIGVEIGNRAADVNIHDTHIVNIGQNALTIEAGSSVIDIHNNVFEDVGVAADNTFDAISVAPNASNWRVDSNWFRRYDTSRRPRFYINIAEGAGTNWSVSQNTFLQPAGTAYGSNSASGPDYEIRSNHPASPFSGSFNAKPFSDRPGKIK